MAGSYTESHTQPVTQLRWHPKFKDHLLSSGDDGVVCVFNTRVPGEADALTTVIAAESAVHTFGFFGDASALMCVGACLSPLPLPRVTTRRLPVPSVTAFHAPKSCRCGTSAPPSASRRTKACGRRCVLKPPALSLTHVFFTTAFLPPTPDGRTNSPQLRVRASSRWVTAGVVRGRVHTRWCVLLPKTPHPSPLTSLISCAFCLQALWRWRPFPRPQTPLAFFVRSP